MAGQWIRRGTALIGLAALLAIAASMQAHAQGSDDFDALNKRVLTLYRQGKYAEATEIARRSLTLAEKKFGPEHPGVGNSLNNLALLYKAQGRYAEAEALHKRNLALREKALGPDHPDVGNSLNNLATVYEAQGRYSEAEALHKRNLALREKALGSDHPDVGNSLNNLALLYAYQGRNTEAEPLYKRALAIVEKTLGPDHAYAGLLLNNLADLYASKGLNTEAEPLFKRALQIREKVLGPDHPEVGHSLGNLAHVYKAQGRYGEAEPLYKRSLAIIEKALGPDHADVGRSLANLAGVYEAQSRYGEAESLYKRSLALYEKALGPDHHDVATGLSHLARLSFVGKNWRQAADYWRRSTSIVIQRTLRGTSDVGQSPTGKQRSEAERVDWRFRQLVKVAHRLVSEERKTDASLAQEMFQTAQWAQGSEAAASIAQMAVRGARGNPRLEVVVRERQDLVAEWQKLDGARTAAVSRAPDMRDKAAEATNIARLSEIDARIATIDKQLAADFPDYAALSRPEAMPVEEVQAQLRPDEALVLFLDTAEWKPTPEETFVWVVTKTDMRWVKSELGTPALVRETAALRCGLDAAAWVGEGAVKCATRLKIAPDHVLKGNGPLPFDAARAHLLYRALFNQVEDLIRDKHLLIVPSGPLTQLPFQVLVTASPANGDHRLVAWLVRQNPVTVLPAVSSLKALRRVANVSKAARPYIGFGNPLLLGPDGNDRRAWERQSCKGLSASRQVASRSIRAAIPRFFRGGLADVEEVRAQYPLPETADELCAVAQSMGVGQEAVYLGEKASETTLKAVSANGTLASARVVHFATHGLLAGETEMLAAANAEPSLILSPPQQATEEDDGLLTASEITQLKLDADWVILSACNTAAGTSDKPGAEALSGLARAFFYAGARALLVSHWAVNSDATVKLITKAFDEIKADPKIGRAEALRRSMLALVATGGGTAHPANWAPFVVVGEGAAAQ